MDTTSVSLLKRLQDPSDREVWKEFVTLYTPMVHRWATGLNLSESDANDLTQDVFLTLLKELPTFRYDPNQSFRGWLRTVAINRARDFLKRAYRKDLSLVETQNAASVDVDHVQFLSDREYEQQISLRILTFIRQEFEEKTWRACWMTLVESRPASEVAKELEISPNAVYVAKSRVLRRLRSELDGLID